MLIVLPSKSLNRFILSKKCIHALLLTYLLMITGCGQQTSRVELTGFTMGTSYSVVIYSDEALSQDEKLGIKEKIDQRLLAINAVASTYQDDSELSRLNRRLAQNNFNDGPLLYELSSDLEYLLQLSLDISEKSQGGFDVTVGNLVNAWGFGPDGATINEFPEGSAAAQLEVSRQLDNSGFEALALVESQKLQVSRQVQIDLSAVAKGWGVDEVATLLEGLGLASYLIEIGGEIRVGQAKPSGPWQIAIEKPTQDALSLRAPYRVLALADASVATSGDYRNYREINGQRYSHAIDPTTGRPVQHGLASVTVIADTAAFADAWATALMILGPARAAATADRLGLSAILMSYEGSELNVQYTSNFLASFPEPSNNM